MSTAKEDFEKLGITALEVTKAITDYTKQFFPPIKILSYGMGLVLKHYDDSSQDVLKALETGFKTINNDLDKLTALNKDIMNKIMINSTEQRFNKAKSDMEQQYKDCLAVVNASPENKEKKKKGFGDSYISGGGDTHLYMIYNSVMGKPMLFSEPVLQVYEKYTNGDKETMRKLCEQLLYLLGIGIATVVAYKYLFGGNPKAEVEKWVKNMENVQEKMQKYK